MESFLCNECGRGTVRQTYITQNVEEGGHKVLVKGVPIGLCPRCGKKYFHEHVVARVNELASNCGSETEILYTNEYATPGVPDACPEDEK